MFFRSSLFYLTLIATAVATPYKRAEGLIVKVSAASPSFTSVADLKFTASVKNTGTEAVKILKYGTILDDKLPTKSFVVTKDGVAVAFTGVKVNFASAGAGKFSFHPITNFLMASGAQAKVSQSGSFSMAQASTNVVEVELSENVSKRELEVLDKRATDICTISSKKTFIDASYAEAKTLASTASSYITSKGSSDSVYKAYFGTTSTSKVMTILNAVANENSSSRTLSCVDTYSACSSGVIAYTVISTTNVYFCSIFFNEVATSSLCSGTTVASRNVRGGTTLHELTHAVGGTDDVTYGCSADQALSTANKAINADNYNCFTTQVYANTKC
ncbi:Metalloprotease [Flammula alnicola]|nr:Metalloprotease [Flammula alnicola]